MRREKIIIIDKDLAKAEIALRRAAKQARRIAARTNTPLIIYENGRVKRIWVKEKTRSSSSKTKAQS